MTRRSTRKHVDGVLFCVTHQIPFEDEPNCHCGVLHGPTLRECAEPCPLWTDPEPVFFHGTRRGFKPGGYLMPRCVHEGAGTTAPVTAGHQSPEHSGDWVYVTTSKTLAWVYAWHAVGKGRPKVLTVRPIGDIEPDPEHSVAMGAYRTEMAKVLSVDSTPVVTEAEAREGWVTA